MIQALANHIVSVIYTVVVGIAIAAGFGWFAANRWGTSRSSRRAIFSVVGGGVLLLVFVVAQVALRSGTT